MIKRCQMLGLALATAACFVGRPVVTTVYGQNPSRSMAGATSHSVSVGKLIRSGQSRSGTVRYALLDDDGSITTYVIAAPGVDLDRHVNAHVGITAREVRRPSGTLPYALAQSVSRISEPTESDEQEERETDEDQVDILASAMAEFQEDGKGSLADLMWSDIDEQIVPAGLEEEIAEPLADDDPAFAAQGIIDDSVYYPGLPDDALMAPTRRSLLMDSYSAGLGCGDPGCNACVGRGCFLGGGPLWVRAELLGWWQKPFETPPLVTRSAPGTSAEDAGVLGLQTTDVVFGSQDLLDEFREGGRIAVGKWLDPCLRNGIEVEFFTLGEDSEGFGRSSAGDPILARPFFNALLDTQDSELVAFPGLVAGSVTVVAHSELDSFAPRYRRNLWCRTASSACAGPCDSCGPWKPAAKTRLDATLGYRYMKLNEQLSINERLTTLDTNTLSTFDLTDTFGTSNEFNGAELSLIWDLCYGRLSFELLGRLSLGNTRRVVAIDGVTTSTTQAASFSDPGGLLALQSNIGQHEDDKFTAIPEFGANVGYNITPCVRFIFGYSVLYWDGTVRPGDQIDLRVNTDFLPPALDTQGPTLPSVAFRESSFWVHGLNIGVDWHW